MHATTATPPPLPHGELVTLADRGELFVRRVDGTDSLPTVLIHGWQVTADLNFFPVLGACPTRPVIAADLRGHGRSVYPEAQFSLADAADDIAALLRHFGHERAIVLGYSLGTAVAQVMVQRHPDMVAGMVLAGGLLEPNVRVRDKVFDRIGGWFATAQRLTAGRRIAHGIVSKSARENPALESLRGWLVTEMERGHSATLRSAGRALASFDGRPIADTHRVPTTVVITRRDRLVPPKRQELLAAAWRADVIDLDADHDAPLAQPQRFVAACVAAIERVRANVEVAASS